MLPFIKIIYVILMVSRRKMAYNMTKYLTDWQHHIIGTIEKNGIKSIHFMIIIITALAIMMK